MLFSNKMQFIKYITHADLLCSAVLKMSYTESLHTVWKRARLCLLCNRHTVGTEESEKGREG